MIVVSIDPDQILLKQPTDLKLRLTNTGSGPCTGIRYTFRVPKEILLLRGRRQFTVNLLEKGTSYEHALRVKAQKPGQFSLIGANFSYRDFRGRAHRVRDSSVALRVVPQTRVPIPVLNLRFDSTKLQVNLWSPLSGTITNTGKGPARDVNISLTGPAIKARQTVVGELLPGKSTPFTISVYASEAGTRVPIDVQVLFQDEKTQQHKRHWHHYLNVETKTSSIDVDDVYFHYETGLSKLLIQLGQRHSRYTEALSYQHRLQENLNQARRHGDTETRRAERAEIVNRLNELTLAVLGKSFNNLCEETE